MGLIFKLRHWYKQPAQLQAFVFHFGSIWGYPNASKMPQKCIKSYFLVVLDYFFYENGPIDLIKGLFSSFDIGTHILPTCEPCVPFWVQLAVPKYPKTA
jgi:hypothetical protein